MATYDRTKTIAGRPVSITSFRVQHHHKEWGYYNRVVVRFLDTNETHSMGGAQFAKWATKLDREYARQVKGA